MRRDRRSLRLFSAAMVMSIVLGAPAASQETRTELELATFAGGCFWCMETPFEKLDGVHEVISGFSGGREVAPSYEQVSSGRTGHTEAVQILFEPAVAVRRNQSVSVLREKAGGAAAASHLMIRGDFRRRGPRWRAGSRGPITRWPCASWPTGCGAITLAVGFRPRPAILV